MSKSDYKSFILGSEILSTNKLLREQAIRVIDLYNDLHITKIIPLSKFRKYFPYPNNMIHQGFVRFIKSQRQTPEIISESKEDFYSAWQRFNSLVINGHVNKLDVYRNFFSGVSQPTFYKYIVPKYRSGDSDSVVKSLREWISHKREIINYYNKKASLDKRVT